MDPGRRSRHRPVRRPPLSALLRSDAACGTYAALGCFALLVLGAFVGAHLVLGPIAILAGATMLPRPGRSRWIGGGLLVGVALLMLSVVLAYE
jgi:hypothetical protein